MQTINRICVLCNDDFVSRFIIGKLFEHYQQEICCIVLSGKKSNIKRLLETVEKSGPLYACFQAINQILHRMLTCRSSIRKMAEESSCCLFRARNISESAVIKHLKRFDLDILLSIQFDQIIKNDLLKLPRIGVINYHKALLPKYRGMAPLFWALFNGEEEIGVTVHFIDEGIDTGALIAQESISVKPEDTLLTLYEKCAAIGPRLIGYALASLSNRSFSPITQEQTPEYFRSPGKEDVREFLRRGKRFFTIRDFTQIRHWHK